MNAAGHVELFREVRAQLVTARGARAQALFEDNHDIAVEYWECCDVARQKLCEALCLLEDAGVLEALSGLIPHIGEI